MSTPTGPASLESPLEYDLTSGEAAAIRTPSKPGDHLPGSPDGEARSSRLIRTVPVGLVLLILVGVTRQALKPLSDPDLWWHLRMGDDLRSGWDFGQTQPWTPFATAPWVRTQWLPELLQSWINSAFGLPGVAWLFASSLIVIVALLYLVCRRQAGTLAAGVATALGFIGMSATLSPRPQLVSFALVLVFVDAWLQTARDLKPRWWLIALTWVWASSHGMWFVGPMLGLTVTLGLVLDRRVRRKQAIRLFLIPVVSLVAAGVTPIGPQLLQTPFNVGKVSSFITEWATPSIRDAAPAATYALIAFVVIMWTRGRRVPWTHLGLLILALGWALLSARTVTLGAAIVAPLFAGSLQGVVGGMREQVHKLESVSLVAVALACSITVALAAPATSNIPGSVPIRFDGQLDRLSPKTVILNEYILGGWLLWRHPSLSPVVDGRTEAYPISYLSEYGGTMAVDKGWEGFVNSSGARWALLKTGSPLATALIERRGWTTVGADEGYVLLHESQRPTGGGLS